MRNLDQNSLWRSTVGFDRLFDLIDESPRWTGEENHYPPYNIERTGEDHYQIALALDGFAPEEVSITAEQNVLTVEARKAEKGEHQYLYQGISARPFRRIFNLADYVEVNQVGSRHRIGRRQQRGCGGVAGDGANEARSPQIHKGHRAHFPNESELRPISCMRFVIVREDVGTSGSFGPRKMRQGRGRCIHRSLEPA
jgi:molecular chaperone IbpA